MAPDERPPSAEPDGSVGPHPARSRPGGWLVGWLGSGLLHLAILTAIAGAPGPTESAFRVRMPAHIDFGTTQETEPGGAKGTGASGAAADPNPPATSPAPAVPAPKTPPKAAKPTRRPRASLGMGVDEADTTPARPHDAGTTTATAGDERDAGAGTNAAGLAAGGSGLGDADGGWGSGHGQGFGRGDGAGAGGFLALRFDSARVRDTSLVLELRSLLAVIPGWRERLRSAGIRDPLASLQRVLVASADLQALFVAVRTRAGGPPPPGFVGAGGRIAYAAGELQLGPVLAALCRTQGCRSEASALSDLLQMEEAHPLELTLEGAHHYLQGPPELLPRRIQLGLRNATTTTVDGWIHGRYATEVQAAEAAESLSSLLTQLADHPRAQLLGLTSSLREARIEQQGRTVQIESELTLHQLRHLLGFLRRAIQRAAQQTSASL